MGYEIYTDHRLETLVGDHLDLFRTGFFGPRPSIVLQNQSLAQWLKLHLARTTGGYVTGDFVFQDEALRRLLDASGAAPGRVLFLDDLKISLYRYLARVLGPGADPVFLPLTGGGRPDPVRLFELADHIAGVFHNYAMNSLLWPSALSSCQLPSGSQADPGAFAWQSRLWQDLLTGEGTLAGLVLDRLTRRPPAPWGPAARLILVGSAFLSRRTAAFLRAWADEGLIEVVHLLLLPAPPVPQWPDQRPWTSWGTFGKAFLESMPPPPSKPAAPSPAAGALSVLQDSLIRGLPFPGAPADGTLEILSCPHPLRELELVRDRLLAALAADPTLEVNDIAVLAPDIKVYAPFLDEAFGSDDPGRNLKFHVIDLDLGRENQWFRALDALLALVSGTIDRPNLFTLTGTPAFRETWQVGEEEQALWLDYTEEVSAWREDEGLQSWTAGWDRMFEGWFRSEGPAGSAPPLTAPPSAFRDLGRFHQLLDALVTRAEETRRPRGFLDWTRFLDGLAADFLGPGDGTAAVLSGRLRTLVREEDDAVLPWAGFRAFVQDQIAHFPGRRGQLLTEGIHCSSLRPLRAIPFRIIAVLGLDEGRFPRQTPLPSFDLRRHEPDQDRVSALALERYCFWETVMAARTRLLLSYQGRSAVDGEERPPSTVLADLLDYLESDGREWPVVRGSVKDFSVLEPGLTWSPRTVRRAAAAAGTGTLRIPGPSAGPGRVSLEEVFPEVRTSEVVEAFTRPARFHLKRVGQLVLRDEDRRGTDGEEPWSLSFLDRQAWLQEGLRRRWAGIEPAWDVDGMVSRALATGQIRPGVFAERDRRELTRRSLQAQAWADGLRDEGWVLAVPRSPDRTRWAGRPWAPEPDDRLIRGRAVLIPRLLPTGAIPVRVKFEVALRLLQEPETEACLATLNPKGEDARLAWGFDRAQTEGLARAAERYWDEAASRPLALYPDLVEALARRRAERSGEPWEESVEAAWRKARTPGFGLSEATLGRDPYANLAFADDQPPETLAADAARWWDELLAPLLEAWA